MNKLDQTFFDAVKSGNLGAAEWLLTAGANIHVDNEEILIRMASEGNLHEVKWLVEHGADVTACASAAKRHAIGRLNFITANYLDDVEKSQKAHKELLEIHAQNIKRLSSKSDEQLTEELNAIAVEFDRRRTRITLS